MSPSPRYILMTDPEHYEVSYVINPWMRPASWAADRASGRAKARAAWDALARELRGAGMTVEVMSAEPGSPDLVFPANAAIVLDGCALLSRFRHPQRRAEEVYFGRYFDALRRRGLIADLRRLPEGIFQEGAGDCLWDGHRQVFWAGYGPRSERESLAHIRSYFAREVIGLELVTAHYYHLDTCFCPLPGGEVMYFPPAFSARALAEIAERVSSDKRIVATAAEAMAFCLNAVGIGRNLIMAPPPPRLRAILQERGYHCRDVDLSSFMLSGGGAFCMTLRLDLKSRSAARGAAEPVFAREERP